MIAIVDCGVGNIGSLVNTLAYLGESAAVISQPGQLRDYGAAILPGVGRFDAAARALAQGGMSEAVKDFARSGKPLLGICLGLQLLCDASEEGELAGLGLIPGSVRHLRSLGCREKVPHVGFNAVEETTGDSRFLARALGNDFYFVHSFALEGGTAGTEPVSAAYSRYGGVRFVSALQRGKIFATQFHPEKSGEAGLALLSEFLSCSKNA